MSEQFQIGSYNVTVKSRIAEGGFGFVDLVCESTGSRRDFVLKRCDVQRKESMDTVKKEISLLENFAGPYVVKYLGADIITTKIGHHRQALILLEYCPGGHLLDRLLARNGVFLPVEIIYRIFGQLSMAVGSLHNHNPPTVHRDLKLENVLFGQDGNVRLCDFGSAETTGSVPLKCSVDRANAEEILAKETTQMYRAPEMCDLFLRDELTEKTDIWAMGCIFYALCYLTHPFQDCGPLGILNGKMAPPPVAAKDHVPSEAVIMLQRMLDLDPEARPSCTQLIESFAALSRKEPLPPYELSALALQKRAEREAAAQKRASKQVKKAYHLGGVLPPKPKLTAATGDVSGAAARRLAAKKGVSYQAFGHNDANVIASNTAANGGGFDAVFNDGFAVNGSNASVGFDADFSGAGAATFGTDTTTTTANSPSDVVGSSGNEFDPFGDNSNSNQSDNSHGFDDSTSANNAVDTADSLFADACDQFQSSSAAAGVVNFDDMFSNGISAGIINSSTSTGTSTSVVRPPTPLDSHTVATGGVADSFSASATAAGSFFDPPQQQFQAFPTADVVNFDNMFSNANAATTATTATVRPPTPSRGIDATATNADAAAIANSLFDDATTQQQPENVNFDDMFGSSGSNKNSCVIRPPTPPNSIDGAPPPALPPKPLSCIFQPVNDSSNNDFEYSAAGAQRAAFDPFGGGTFKSSSPPVTDNGTFTNTAAATVAATAAAVSLSFSEFDGSSSSSSSSDSGAVVASASSITAAVAASGSTTTDFDLFPPITDNSFGMPVTTASKSVQVDLFNQCMEESSTAPGATAVGPTSTNTNTNTNTNSSNTSNTSVQQHHQDVLSMFDRPVNISNNNIINNNNNSSYNTNNKFEAMDQLANQSLRPGMMPPQGQGLGLGQQGRGLNRGSINMGPQQGGGWSGMNPNNNSNNNNNMSSNYNHRLNSTSGISGISTINIIKSTGSDPFSSLY